MPARRGDFIRNLGQLLDHMVEPRAPGDRARIAAQGAMAGISEQVQASVPELHAEDLERFVVNLVLVLDRLVGEAAQHLEAGEKGYLALHLAEGVVRGLAGELRAAAPELRARALRFLDEAQVHTGLQKLLEERRAERKPGEQGFRARVLGEGAVRGVSAELKRQIPEIEQALVSLLPASRRLASQLVEQAVASLVENSGEVIAALELVSEAASRKAVQGIFAELEEQLRSAKSRGVADAAAAALERRIAAAAAAMVRGAIGAVAEEAKARQIAPRAFETIARGSRAGVDGVVSALKQRLRKPLLWSAGLGAALGLAMLARRAGARA
jgi:hypothetical protein